MHVEDQGVGFDYRDTRTTEEALGLAGMRERAVLWGGQLKVESAPGAGTCIMAELPLAMGEPLRDGLPQRELGETTIILAHDQQIVRQGLRALLEVVPDFRVIGEVSEGLKATELTEQLKPNVLVVALSIHGLSGLEIARQVRQRSPGTGIVILSMHKDEGYVLEALRAGAHAYVLSQAQSNEVVRAIQEAAAGRQYLSAPFSEGGIQAYSDKEAATHDLYQTLTPREQEILHLAAEGRTNAEIAAHLYISTRTVRVHRFNVMRKLNLRNQAELIRFVLENRPPLSGEIEDGDEEPL